MVSDATKPAEQPGPEVLAINHEEGYMVLDDDSTALIDIYIDSFGCDTEDPEEAAAVVGRISDGAHKGQWVVVDLSKFVKMELN